METIELLLAIAEKAGMCGEKEFTTGVLSKNLKVSQQTVSNELRRLEAEGLITRTPFYRGVKVGVADKGIVLLESYKKRLTDISKDIKKLKGKVFSGLGEGKFYVMQQGYKKQFRKSLGYTPFAGTLNIRVDSAEAQKFLLQKKPIIIRGFKAKNRTYGALKCFEVKINNTKAAIVMPERTHHGKNTIEIIAKKYLRKELSIKDNDLITISGV